MSLVQCIQDQDSYYRKLTTELSTETRIENELLLVKNDRQHLEHAIQTKKAETNALEQNSKKEYRDVRKLRHLSFKSAAATLSGKKKEIIAKEEARYQLAFENEQRSKRDLEQLETRYQTALTREEELIRQKGRFVDTRHQYTSLLEQIFATEDPGFPSEPQLKAELRNYKEQRRLAKRDKNRFVEAENALSTCITDTKKVIRLLDTVVNYVSFEIFGGPIIDEEQVAYLDAAKKKIWEIQRLLNVARTVLPEIPYPHTLDVVTNNTLLSMQINLNYVDVAWKAKTTQCFSMLATAYSNIQNSLTWVKQYIDYTIGAIARLNTAVESAQENLDNERRRIMDSVLAGHIYGESSNNDILINEPPPPVYEAPPAEYTSTAAGTQENQQDHLPVIPSNITPSSSLPNFSLVGDHSPLIPAATVATAANSNNTLPPHPITPVFGDTNLSPSTTVPINILDSNHSPANNQQSSPSYISHNVNNPFSHQNQV